ncbi:LysR family transcriptional regulator [Ancylobacter defluvii]|uniref:LysR family transcriptional regulator n=1 Tax=Ancylobacter defluvii TaxID=1282440 RepID=A0A9W6JSA9_9HYPH|nr:LysR family transcriptional regulator [Ancylobacter defluvii]MBS7590205.1 LysR family transcriptional regulator [Ancylobacter defluvii]GLK82846.1 LysR family transcriptional regulator [Ancylobacter defluvii]
MESIWLEDYLALAETLNFSRAAERRHVTQPAFSRRVRALEQWVGTELFVRTTHSVSLTTAGQHFRTQAQMLSRTIQQLRRDTLAIAERHAQTLTIAATHVLSFTFFPSWIRRNDELFGRGNLNLLSDSMEACEQIIARGDAQFLLCHYHAAAPGRFDSHQFKSVVVGTDTLVPVSAPAPDGRPLWSLENDGVFDYLAYSEKSGLGRIIAAVKDDTPSRATPHTVFTSHLAATLLTMARSGVGVAWLPTTLAEDDLREKRLVPAAGPDAAIPVEIRLFRPVARQSEVVESAWAALT